jgi:hypothetical protein
VRVLWARPSPDDFHARFSARSRTYRYLLLDDAVAPAALRGRVGWFHKPLDVEAMARRGDVLGEHDFSAFRDAQCQAKSPVKLMHGASVERRGGLVLHLPRQRVPAPHGAQHRGLAGLRGRGRTTRRGSREVFARRTAANAAPTFAPTGSTSRASSTIRRSPSALSAVPALPDAMRNAHQDLRHARARARALAARGGRGCDRPRLPRDSPRYVEPSARPRRRGAAAVRDDRGLFVNARSASAARWTRVPLDMLQFHGHETPRGSAMRPTAGPTFAAVRMGRGGSIW